MQQEVSRGIVFGNPVLQIETTSLGVRNLEFNIHGPMHRKNIRIYVQQFATLHSLFYLETALHASAGTTTHRQERKQLYLQHLVELELRSTIAADSSNGVTNAKCCRYSCLRS
jgi:hypothetical protein